METRKSLLAKLHIARKDLGLDDDTYRAMLENLTSKRSAADLSDRQLGMVVAALRKSGWIDRHPRPTGKPAAPRAPRVRPEYQRLLGKLNALRLDTGKTWAYVEAIAEKMYGLRIPWLDKGQLVGVITAMAKHQQAAERRTA